MLPVSITEESRRNRIQGYRRIALVLGVGIGLAVLARILDATVAPGLVDLISCSFREATPGYPLHIC